MTNQFDETESRIDPNTKFCLYCAQEVPEHRLFCRPCFQGDSYKDSDGLPGVGEVCEVAHYGTNVWCAIKINAIANGKCEFESDGKRGFLLTRFYKFRPIQIPDITH